MASVFPTAEYAVATQRHSHADGRAANMPTTRSSGRRKAPEVTEAPAPKRGRKSAKSKKAGEEFESKRASFMKLIWFCLGWRMVVDARAGDQLWTLHFRNACKFLALRKSVMPFHKGCEVQQGLNCCLTLDLQVTE